MLSTLALREAGITVTSDASGSWGCGAFWDDFWLQMAWDDSPEVLSLSIAMKEMVPVITACTVWGGRWAGQHVLVRSDNEAVVSVIKARCCKDEPLMHLLRTLFFSGGSFWVLALL